MIFGKLNLQDNSNNFNEKAFSFEIYNFSRFFLVFKKFLNFSDSKLNSGKMMPAWRS